MQLKNVVFPAPFGPISATISPGTHRDQVNPKLEFLRNPWSDQLHLESLVSSFIHHRWFFKFIGTTDIGKQALGSKDHHAHKNCAESQHTVFRKLAGIRA